MSMKSSLITYLNTKTGITDLVASRIRTGYAEHKERLPYVVIHNIDAVHEHHLEAATGFIQGRFQFDCYGVSPTAAADLAEQVRQALDGFRGTMDSVYVSTCRLDSERDDVTPPIEGADLGIYSVQQDYMISWSVSVPTFA